MAEARLYALIYAAGALGALASVATRLVDHPADAHIVRHLLIWPAVSGVVAATLTGLAWWALTGTPIPDPVGGPLVASCVGLSGIKATDVGPMLRRTLRTWLKQKGIEIDPEDRP